jgi:hypothetical protein
LHTPRLSNQVLCRDRQRTVPSILPHSLKIPQKSQKEMGQKGDWEQGEWEAGLEVDRVVARRLEISHSAPTLPHHDTTLCHATSELDRG